MKASERSLSYLMDLLSKTELRGWEEVRRFIATYGINVSSFDELLQSEVRILIGSLQDAGVRRRAKETIRRSPDSSSPSTVVS